MAESAAPNGDALWYLPPGHDSAAGRPSDEIDVLLFGGRSERCRDLELWHAIYDSLAGCIYDPVSLVSRADSDLSSIKYWSGHEVA